MAQLLVIYQTPSDTAAFDKYYHEVHIPLARKIPGLRSCRITDGPIHAIAGTAPYLVATLEFDSVADIQAGLASAEGQATAGDLANFDTAGVTLLISETRAV